ncbi:MAG: hypothetical protein Q8O40_17210 [Chloroflexota bacterium]|nr:hypothetical protein [Chloroflexota bacterium]
MEFTVRIGREGDQRSVWQQVDDVLGSAFRRAGFKQVDLSKGKSTVWGQQILSGLQDEQNLIPVAPGVLLSRREYEKRYGGFDLEQFRRTMTPELFKVFVRYMGLIPGDAQVDVNWLASSPY